MCAVYISAFFFTYSAADAREKFQLTLKLALALPLYPYEAGDKPELSRQAK